MDMNVGALRRCREPYRRGPCSGWRTSERDRRPTALRRPHAGSTAPSSGSSAIPPRIGRGIRGRARAAATRAGLQQPLGRRAACRVPAPASPAAAAAAGSPHRGNSALPVSGPAWGSRWPARGGRPAWGSAASAPRVGRRGEVERLVRSPVCVRRQRLRLGTSGPKRVSRKRSIEVWSKVCEHTKPPRENGEITSIGTRKPSPIGPRMPPAIAGSGSTRQEFARRPGGGTGGGTWSKKPPFSS